MILKKLIGLTIKSSLNYPKILIFLMQKIYRTFLFKIMRFKKDLVRNTNTSSKTSQATKGLKLRFYQPIGITKKKRIGALEMMIINLKKHFLTFLKRISFQKFQIKLNWIPLFLKLTILPIKLQWQIVSTLLIQLTRWF